VVLESKELKELFGILKNPTLIARKNFVL